MFSTKIRPVTDLRNKYPEVEKDIADGPVMLTKNGYGSAVLLSVSLYDELMKRNEIYESIAKSEAAIDAGQGLDAKAALKKTRAKLKI